MKNGGDPGCHLNMKFGSVKEFEPDFKCGTPH